MIERIKFILNILIVALLLATVTIQRDGRVAGVEVSTIFQAENESSEAEVPIESTLNDGVRVINSTSLAKSIIGFGGRTPVKVYVKDDVIHKVELEPNSETPSFIDEVIKSGLLKSWDGMKLSKAATQNIDAVSGATYSSIAIIGNVQAAAQYGANVEPGNKKIISDVSLKDIVGLIIILLGVILTFFKPRNKLLTTFHLLLNIIVLGFWCGSFLSLATFTSWIGNGINLSVSIVTFAMLCVIIIMPLLGMKGSYCHIHCPMGSAQELLGRVSIFKIKLSPKMNKRLNNLRYYILMTLLFMMWLGVGFELMDYEIFSAFIFSSASTVVLVMAAIFLILSLFIHKPYCRFICPTGALITMSQKTKP